MQILDFFFSILPTTTATLTYSGTSNVCFLIAKNMLNAKHGVLYDCVDAVRVCGVNPFCGLHIRIRAKYLSFGSMCVRVKRTKNAGCGNPETDIESLHSHSQARKNN